MIDPGPLLFIPGGPELLIIFALIILFFGASRIPKIARASGQAIGEFRKGRSKSEEIVQEEDSSTAEEPEH